MRPAVVRGKRTMTRGRTSNYTPTITSEMTGEPSGEPTGKASKFPTLTPSDFFQRARCRNHPNAEWWFAPHQDRWEDQDGQTHFQVITTRADAEKAKQLCDVCPVKMQCLQWSLENRQLYGIYGGIDEEQRREMMGPLHQRNKRIQAVN